MRKTFTAQETAASRHCRCTREQNCCHPCDKTVCAISSFRSFSQTGRQPGSCKVKIKRPAGLWPSQTPTPRAPCFVVAPYTVRAGMLFTRECYCKTAHNGASRLRRKCNSKREKKDAHPPIHPPTQHLSLALTLALAVPLVHRTLLALRRGSPRCRNCPRVAYLRQGRTTPHRALRRASTTH